MIRNLKSKTCGEPSRTIQNLKWCVIGAIAVTLTFSGGGVEAQQQAKVFKIGWLGVRPVASDTGLERLRKELGGLGYVEGKNTAFEYRSADDKLDRLPTLADELCRLKVDVLVAATTPAAVAAKNATRTIPIVFYGGFDAVALGVVNSMARPGGNATGFSGIASILVGKRLELLKETLPQLSRVAVLWDPQNPVLRNSGKKANCRHENWVCNFTR